MSVSTAEIGTGWSALPGQLLRVALFQLSHREWARCEAVGRGWRKAIRDEDWGAFFNSEFHIGDAEDAPAAAAGADADSKADSKSGASADSVGPWKARFRRRRAELHAMLHAQAHVVYTPLKADGKPLHTGRFDYWPPLRQLAGIVGRSILVLSADSGQSLMKAPFAFGRYGVQLRSWPGTNERFFATLTAEGIWLLDAGATPYRLLKPEHEHAKEWRERFEESGFPCDVCPYRGEALSNNAHATTRWSLSTGERLPFPCEGMTGRDFGADAYSRCVCRYRPDGLVDVWEPIQARPVRAVDFRPQGGLRVIARSACGVSRHNCMLCISPQNAWHLEVINVSTGRQMWVRGIKSSSAAAGDGAVCGAAAAGDEKGESKQPAAVGSSEAKQPPQRSLAGRPASTFPLPASCCFALSDRVLACCTHERPRHLWLVDFATGRERAILFPQPLLSVSQMFMDRASVLLIATPQNAGRLYAVRVQFTPPPPPPREGQAKVVRQSS